MRETSQSDFSVGYSVQLAYQGTPKILNEKSLFLGFQEASKSSKCHKLALAAFLD
jgi:hypothetical protein